MSDPTHPNAGSRRPVLLVEDDLDQAHLMRFLLEDGGDYQVTLAQDGVRGSELAREGRWALVITDLNLPGAFGFEVMRASRTASPDTPILATTGFSESDYVAGARSEGADAVLLKPVERDLLLGHVTRLVDTDTAEPAPGVALHVLAVGLRAGEVEAGCGGTLLRHLRRNDHVALLVLGESDPELAEMARACGRRLGTRFFVASADTEDAQAFEATARELLGRAFRDIRPDVLYLPTPHRRDPLGGTVHSLALALGSDVPRVFSFDPGDPTPGFRPELFVPIDRVLEEKADLLRVYGAPEGAGLDAGEVVAGARFWGRFVGAEAAEALEVARGLSPWEGASSPEDPERKAARGEGPRPG
jgi:CheY-like chemotaxis protein